MQIALVKFKDTATGKWNGSGSALDRAYAMFLAMSDDANGSYGDYGFGWIVHCLSRYCLYRATEDSSTEHVADKWIERYKALRGIR